MEANYEDKGAWTTYIDEQGDIYVYRRCECGKFLSMGEVQTNDSGNIKFVDFRCATHGEKQPHYERL